MSQDKGAFKRVVDSDILGQDNNLCMSSRVSASCLFGFAHREYVIAFSVTVCLDISTSTLGLQC